MDEKENLVNWKIMLNYINDQDIKLTNDSALRKLIKLWIKKSIYYIYIYIHPNKVGKLYIYTYKVQVKCWITEKTIKSIIHFIKSFSDLITIL